jgi:predicted nucleotidyltransferase
MERLPVEGEGGLLDWLRFLKAETEEEFKMVAAKNPMIEEAYCKLQVMSEDEANRMLYEARLKAQRDEYSRKSMDGNVPFIDKIVSMIVSLVSPDQIILFGSYARGDNTEKSDIDLLIIKKNLKNGREMNNILYRAFFENKIGIPVDLISVDYNKYMELNTVAGYIYKTIKKEGKILYGTL